MERGREYRIKTHHLFVDCHYRALRQLNIPSKLIRLIRMTMTGQECVVQIQGDLSSSFPSERGVRQGGTLACVLFNLAHERSIRYSRMQTTGTIVNRKTQLLAYENDIDVVGRSRNTVKEAFLSLVEAAGKLGLVDEEKTKCMVGEPGEKVEFGPYQFEHISSFTYVGSQVTCTNDIGAEVKKRILSANRCYFGLGSTWLAEM